MSGKLEPSDRRYFIGGSDARIIMGDDEAALVRLWREKRGEVEPEDLSAQPHRPAWGRSTEPLNRHWFERNTGQVLTAVQRRVQHPVVRWMAATLDGDGRGHRGGFRSEIHVAVVVLPKRARPKNTCRSCSTICGSPTPSCRCSRSSPEAANGSRSVFRPTRSTSTSCSQPRKSSGGVLRAVSRLVCSASSRLEPRIEAVRIVDMSASNSWAELAGLFRSTRQAFLEHEQSKAELKALMPEDAKEAVGHGVRAKRSKSGAISFDLLEVEGGSLAAL